MAALPAPARAGSVQIWVPRCQCLQLESLVHEDPGPIESESDRDIMMLLHCRPYYVTCWKPDRGGSQAAPSCRRLIMIGPG